MNGGPPRPPFRTTDRSARRARRSGASTVSAEVTERLAVLETAVAALTQAQADHGAGLTEAIDRLDKQLARSGREQFKANTLAEAQQKNAETILEQLREAGAHRER